MENIYLNWKHILVHYLPVKGEIATAYYPDRRAYDRAAIKFRGVDADINFNLSDYDDDMKQVK